ncbi:hypothetical protein VTN49DRAFT_3919 [Thermomyces lanuginosus]|uniref:uncharacterized protein n=1 Tax=Thermomyces lanuginosus TaxID=5541 RepID=UPI003743D298
MRMDPDHVTSIRPRRHSLEKPGAPHPRGALRDAERWNEPRNSPGPKSSGLRCGPSPSIRAPDSPPSRETTSYKIHSSLLGVLRLFDRFIRGESFELWRHTTTYLSTPVIQTRRFLTTSSPPNLPQPSKAQFLEGQAKAGELSPRKPATLLYYQAPLLRLLFRTEVDLVSLPFPPPPVSAPSVSPFTVGWFRFSLGFDGHCSPSYIPYIFQPQNLDIPSPGPHHLRPYLILSVLPARIPHAALLLSRLPLFLP